ncbi:tetratricopeptide repeat protein [Candidatus Babeliales bacterium]|nr:tetratricopeptide repeat protein [Candidatus Babeliales bacterium]
MTMKNIYAIFILFNFLKLSADSLLVAVLMVKNEASVMEMTLLPLVDAGITDFFIYDTGSTDNTIAVTQEFFQKNNISNYVIEQGEWIDFAASRNQALDLTEQYFPNAKFMVMLDAEWILHGGHELLQFCIMHEYDIEPLYAIKFSGSAIDFYHPRLIRCKSNVVFVGKVHETTNIVANKKVDDVIFFEYKNTKYGYQKSQQRWQKDLKILHQELQNYPEDPRILSFLGQTYAALGDFTSAIKYFKQRLTVPGFVEENFLTLCFLAQAYAQVGDEDNMNYYALKAFEFRSTRAEPLVFLAQYYYEHEQYHLCYVFARHACTISYPDQEILLVDRAVYDYTRYALLSATAHLMGDYDLGKEATLKALQKYPEEESLQKNLKFYENA